MYTNIAIEGNNVLLKETNGKLSKEKFKPTLYAKVIQETDYKGLYGENVRPITFDSIWDMRTAKKQSKYYGDIKPESLYLVNKYTKENYDSASINDLTIFQWDIEIYSEDGVYFEPEKAVHPINAISLIKEKDNVSTIHLWGLEYEGCERFDNKQNVDYRPFNTERDLLVDFVRFWTAQYPDIISGWNSDKFDDVYTYYRILKVLGETTAKKLSPWSIIKEKQIKSFDTTVAGIDFVGVAQLDLMELYKKFSFTPQESYSLNHIANSELGDRKIDYSEVDGLHELYTQSYSKFMEYSVKDTQILKRLEEKRNFLAMVVDASYYAKINFEDIFSPIKTWDSIIFHHLLEQNILIPPPTGNKKTHSFKGAYVKEVQKGKHNWVVSVDLASLYPSIIRQVNISPETLLDEVPNELLNIRNNITEQGLIDKDIDLSALKKHNVSMSSSGQFFSNNKQGFLPFLMEQIYNKRKIDKGKMLEYQQLFQDTKDKKYDILASVYKTKQSTAKVLLNSAYGATGAEYFRFYDIRLAESVTLTGRVAIQWIERKLNEYFNNIMKTDDIDRIILVDTDSVYLSLGSFVDKYLKDKPKMKIVDALDSFFKNKVEPFMLKSYEELQDYHNNVEQLMIMDREGISDLGIVVQKKAYFLRVIDNEGVRYKEPKMKIMGLALIKTNTPEFCRKELKSMLPSMLDNNNDINIEKIENFKSTEWNTASFESIAIPKGVNEIEKYINGKDFISGTPLQSRAAGLYNRLIKEHKLNKRESIVGGEKVKVLYLKLPNPINEKVIGFKTDLPKEFGLDSYVDKELMFQKAFIAPLESIFKALNWKTEKVNELW